ncbi:hypothetical protein BGZ99_005841 [Dissophora globulifera]|uniref:Major facilitator superfamily (MFS) profile domain-containing protein n=1 Tax=Dissophora globulifera TaxID=979702 RepID=A0A9P6UT79_9FUNG|nr:hypothetical protein BGZ99_005841 [Dissophora globulifera]
MAFLSYCKELFHPAPKTDDPKNWPKRKKNIVVAVIAYCAFVAPLASTIYLPAVLQVKDDLHTTSSIISATLSVYVLFMGIMPVFWASLCEYYGRRPIYLVSMMIFILGSLLAAISHNVWVFFVMRGIQAFGASSVLSVGGGSLSDIFHSGERGSAFGLFYLGPLVAPMVGPIIGGVISNRVGWRVTMWLLLGTAVVAFSLVLFVLPETFRHHIDEVADTEKDESSEGVSRSYIHSTHSDPTLVASKASLHGSDISRPADTKNSASSILDATPSSTSDRVSVHSNHTHHSRNSVLPVEGTMEFMIPNAVPPYLVEDGEMAEASCSSSSTKAKDGSTGTESNDSPSTSRHVAFPNAKCEEGLETKEKIETSSKDHDIVEMAADPVKMSSKPKHFNPLRPLVCLKSPTNRLLVGFNALSLGAQFCVNNTLPISFSSIYNMNESTIGICFCAGGLGSIMGSLIGGRYSDYVMRRWLVKQELKRLREQRDRDAMFGNVGASGAELSEKDIAAGVNISMRAPPEVRLQSVWVGVFILPLGLLLYGWSVQAQLPLVAPLIAIFLIGFGMMMVFSSTTTALVDANSDNNQSTAAVACNSFARGVTGAIGGFTALPILGAIGNGWLYTIWAFLTIVGSAGLVLMVVKAKSWRESAAEKALNKV